VYDLRVRDAVSPSGGVEEVEQVLDGHRRRTTRIGLQNGREQVVHVLLKRALKF
jgi:hypothetical protein